jgi:hypothetical protein
MQGLGDGYKATAALEDLRHYIRGPNGQLREGNIRVINTTHDGTLAFAYKSRGGRCNRTVLSAPHKP